MLQQLEQFNNGISLGLTSVICAWFFDLLIINSMIDAALVAFVGATVSFISTYVYKKLAIWAEKAWAERNTKG